MGQYRGLVIALIVVLIIIVVYQYMDARSRRRSCACRRRQRFCAADSSCKNGTEGPWLPPTAQHRRIDAVIGNPDARDLLTNAEVDPEAGARSTMAAGPEAIMAAERQLYQSAAEADSIAPHNTEKMANAEDDLMQRHTQAPGLDYSTVITDIVADPRMRDNQYRWAHAMKGYGANLLKVDDLHDEDYLPFHVLRRQQAGVGQCNPLFVTQINDADLARNKPFKFTG